ncbi:Vacuolar protein sorting-associated protein 53 [Coemansia sp. RSA 989]|nr:Vps53-like protein [Coemansia mojavensis]KAJ1741915.1 Vacuolar protein sorting-associated protein 53 [Coemansia sp. RSA 1086]KAJ1751128.1 Vacuolar protein sorting-associated protein 53 [Coemansia sp. RSA 1821]KAJ1867324.1 Vacuolar protein sorting-associated protein 53 [Coemansia sp. RSA 989]KAJ1874812.1 Vacuolar protein sorting-associated protein 53 [Coemansia sp. RSA 990]KAJ2672347.1 Vacuolar protein sorting-associated protein 53 [Coemansia sp. RSA 1085]
MSKGAAFERAGSNDSTVSEGAKQLDSAGFSLANYIDRQFPDEASLEKIDIVTANIGHRLTTVKQEIRRQLREQSDSQQQQAQSIEATKTAINELYQRISEMKAKAQTSERTVLDITQDIKALDFAKRNVTQATATMRRLQLLVGAVEQLRQLKAQKRYAEAAKILPAIIGLREGFGEYKEVRAIARLDEAALGLQRSLASMAVQEVQRGFDSQGLLVGEPEQMRAACLCCCNEDEKAQIIDAYCDTQLRAYTAIFQLDDDVSQLENVSRRYAWLRRIQRNYAEEHAPAFPDAWRMGEELSRRFACVTRDHLSEILATREIHVEHLTAAVAETQAFEAQSDRNFGIVKREKGFVYEGSGQPAQTFGGLISCAFEPYMAVFVEGEKDKLTKLIRKYERGSLDSDQELGVLASSTEVLFQFRESLRQCAGLSTGAAMVDLANVFAQVLSSYSRLVLEARLPRITAATAAPLDSLQQACMVANTADYCASAASQLEQKIAERVDAGLRDKVSFSSSRDALLGSVNASIGALVNGVESMCESALTTISDAACHVQAVGDQSAYVAQIASAVDTATVTVRQALSGARYFRSYCDKLAARIAARFTAAVAQCTRISEVGAEQLLLDAQALKSVLMRLPTTNSQADQPQQQPSAAYARIVAQGVGRAESLLKTVLVPSEPAEALIDRFLLLFPEAPREVFRQVLRLKGVAAADQPAFIRKLQQFAKTQENTPDLRNPRLPAHIVSSAPASAPLVRQRSRMGEHTRGGSSTSMVFGPSDSPTPDISAAGNSDSMGRMPLGPHHDALGITRHAINETAAEQTSDTASLPATRSKLNENLRRLVSNMRRS